MFKNYTIMYKLDMALNNLQWLMCDQTKPRFGFGFPSKHVAIAKF